MKLSTEPFKDFWSACHPDGYWIFLDPKYMRSNSILGLTEPELDWNSVVEPWWGKPAAFIRHWVETGIRIWRCLHPKTGWLVWEDNWLPCISAWRRPPARAWYTFKAIICILVLFWRSPKDNGKFRWYKDYIEVAGWDFGVDYFGEAEGRVLEVGKGVFKFWYVYERSV